MSLKVGDLVEMDPVTTKHFTPPAGVRAPGRKSDVVVGVNELHQTAVLAHGFWGVASWYMCELRKVES